MALEPKEDLEKKTGLRVAGWKGIGRVTGLVTGASGDVPHYKQYAILLQNRSPIRPRFNVMIQDESVFHGYTPGRAPIRLEFYAFPKMVPEEEARARYDELWEEPEGDARKRFDELRAESIKGIDSPEVVRP